ncbi:LOW QUALITY PROTEIN: hypothetical protein GQ55_3G193400 [Panicum hallii var. hallii]|uniref:Uncharacterized protein n=1 Tax=Panicum hallii var. hallii TaxID=1504633 RepID=A0A2T7EB75_9POAL|nr:LOW QUALITY PROTEIN: hypothetical protein GQ55_3G193400 [Panicum hallii var. hallii]
MCCLIDRTSYNCWRRPKDRSSSLIWLRHPFVMGPNSNWRRSRDSPRSRHVGHEPQPSSYRAEPNPDATRTACATRVPPRAGHEVLVGGVGVGKASCEHGRQQRDARRAK